MMNLFDEHTFFQIYFDILCSYVKSIKSFETIEGKYDHESPGEFFKQLSDDATEIRNSFGKYCISFDVFYIMIYCFIYIDNVDVIGNFVIDLIARICKGYFNEKTIYHEATENILNKFISYKQNTKLYYTLQGIKQGEVSEHISTEFLENYSEIQQLVYNEFIRTVSTPSEQIRKYAFSQSFPFVLFQNNSKFLGFMFMLGYVFRRMN